MNTSGGKLSQDILIVDDTLANLKVLSETLTTHGYEVRAVKNGKTALTAVKTMAPSLILLDINMPEINGYEVCQQLKSDQTTKNIPVIFLTSSNDALDKVKAFESGGADYITKPFQIEEVLARVKNQLDIKAAHHKIRQLNAELEEKVKERTKYLRQKINELEQAKSTLHYTFHDRLTSLPNQLGLSRHLENAIASTGKEKNSGFATFLLQFEWEDVSQFESHLVESKLIMALVKRISASIREVDTLSRIGVNKFAILLPAVLDVSLAHTLAEKIQQQFCSPFKITRQEIKVNLNIGIVLWTREYQKPTQILRDARLALRQAQKKGINSCYLFKKTSKSTK